MYIIGSKSSQAGDMVLIYKIIKTNPGLINCSRIEYEQLSIHECMIKVVNIQLQYKSSGLTNPEKVLLRELLNDLSSNELNESKKEFSLF